MTKDNTGSATCTSKQVTATQPVLSDPKETGNSQFTSGDDIHDDELLFHLSSVSVFLSVYIIEPLLCGGVLTKMMTGEKFSILLSPPAPGSTPGPSACQANTTPAKPRQLATPGRSILHPGYVFG